MGKHFWSKRLDDDSSNKRSSFAWGLVHSLGYHHWRLNIKKMIKHHKHSTQTRDPCKWNPVDDLETKGLLDESENLSHVSSQSTRTSPATKKRSIRERIKAFISEEVSYGSSGRRSKQDAGSSFRWRGHWKHPIGFFHSSLDDRVNKLEANTDISRGLCVLEKFKVDDKELLGKHLQGADEALAGFSCSALRSSSKSTLSKSRSFPVGRLPVGVKAKPVTLESKQRDVWMVPKDTTKASRSNKMQSCENDRDGKTGTADDSGKEVHRRCSSLNDSMEKYTRLFENMSFLGDLKLNASRSLKFANEDAHGQKGSLSNADFRCEIMDEDPCQGEGSGIALENIQEDEAVGNDREEKEEENLTAVPSDDDPFSSKDSENPEILNDIMIGVTRKDPIMDYKTDDQFDEFGVPELVLKSNLDEAKALSAELKVLLDSFSFSPPASPTKLTAAADTLNNSEARGAGEDSGNSAKIHQKVSDLEYVRQILNQSGLATDPQATSWHSSDQPLSPRVLEEVEAFCCQGGQGEEDDLPDFCGYWHHHMMFDLVNEMLVDVYDISCPYYPSPLFSSCDVRLLPVGKRMIEEVSARAGGLLDMKPEEKQSMNSLLSYDQRHDRRWMNLQMDAECVALSLEDVLFHELLEELISF